MKKHHQNGWREESCVLCRRFFISSFNCVLRSFFMRLFFSCGICVSNVIFEVNWSCRRLMSLSALIVSTKLQEKHQENKKNKTKKRQKQHHRKKKGKKNNNENFIPRMKLNTCARAPALFSVLLFFVFGSEIIFFLLKYETRKTLNNLNVYMDR